MCVIGETSFNRDARYGSLAVGELTACPGDATAAHEFAHGIAIALAKQFCQVHRVGVNIVRDFRESRHVETTLRNIIRGVVNSA